MTDAEKFRDEFEGQSGGRDEKGFYALSPAQMIKGRGAKIGPTDPRSCDPSWEVTFPDGSRCRVGNPHQEVFSGFVTAWPSRD